MSFPRSPRSGLYISDDDSLRWKGSLRREVTSTLSKSVAKPTKSPFKTSTHTDLDRAKGRNNVLKEKLAGAQEEKKVMEHSNHELNKQLTWAHTRCVELEAELRQGVARLEQANSLNSTLHENMSVAHARLKEAEGLVEAKNKHVRELETEKAQIQIAHEQHCKQMEERFVHVCKEYQKLELQARELQSKNIEIKQRLDLEAHLRREVEARASTLENQMGILSSQLQVMQSVAKEHQSSGSNLEAQHKREMEEATKELKNKLAERGHRLSQVEEKLMKLERQRMQSQAAGIDTSTPARSSFFGDQEDGQDLSKSENPIKRQWGIAAHKIMGKERNKVANVVDDVLAMMKRVDKTMEGDASTRPKVVTWTEPSASDPPFSSGVGRASTPPSNPVSREAGIKTASKAATSALKGLSDLLASTGT